MAAPLSWVLVLY